MKGRRSQKLRKQLAEQMQATQAAMSDPVEGDPCEAERQALLIAQLNLLAAEVDTLLAQLEVDAKQIALDTCEANNNPPPPEAP